MDLLKFMQDFALPASYRASAERCFLPLSNWISRRLENSNSSPFLLGINGAQGTGKSTLAELLKRHLEDEHKRRVAILSIDDLYLTKAERIELGEKVHPLLRTRGVPGTHDLELGQTILRQLQSEKQGQLVALPRFNKANDDRRPRSEWPLVQLPLDVLILEGWCVGSMPMDANTMKEPINNLEACEDEDGRWRNYVNEQLAGRYTKLFSQLDALIFLQAPDFDAIFNWRLEQEQKLSARARSDQTGIMNEQDIVRFIQHYERITRHNLNHLPSIADAHIVLNEHHEAVSLHTNSGA